MIDDLVDADLGEGGVLGRTQLRRAASSVMRLRASAMTLWSVVLFLDFTDCLTRRECGRQHSLPSWHPG